MTGWHKVTDDDIRTINTTETTEFTWSRNEINSLHCYKINNQICAIISVSQIPEDNGVMWIDNFEVLQRYRGKGIGKRSVSDFLKKYDCPITLIAKDTEVADFWLKCGFEYEIYDQYEIKMNYSNCKINEQR